MNKPFKLIVIVISLLLTNVHMSCNDTDNCEEAICTLVLVRISISITDQDQKPVILDSYEVINLENGENITVSLSPTEQEQTFQSGRYLLIEDNVLGVNQEQQIQFRGFINDQQVISSDYIVSTDCCHVSLVSGDVELTL
ncbi:hypothetical protein SAMN04487910_2359 [Aquimarina amphilecti]|uniref:Tissue inhibitor of metalloproteinase n=1 Tax=Aquimarina amphilecti TaxID=1038014 RepID=A0A1H7PYE9_AQUAM|nr:hypothetical protein [Aquimarina amphilecti]SEL40606.1 hypothetical protein SAMN04487910_2359 [Aquimarina amphilecti]